jgi:hypothetical protein
VKALSDDDVTVLLSEVLRHLEARTGTPPERAPTPARGAEPR